MPVALVTGANKGIGLEIARQLGERGFTVFVGARNAALGEAAAAKLRSESLDARYLLLDLNQPSTSQAAAGAIATEFPHLDVLMNNAAIVDAADGPPGAVDINIVRRIFETNFFGTLAVTQAMLPLLRAAPAARIVNVSSGLRLAYPECRSHATLRRFPIPGIQHLQSGAEHVDHPTGGRTPRHRHQSQCSKPRHGRYRHEPARNPNHRGRSLRTRPSSAATSRRPQRRFLPLRRILPLVTKTLN